MLAGKKSSRPPEPGLDFIRNKQSTVFAAKVERRSQVIIRWNEDALALYWLNDNAAIVLEANARSSAPISLNGTSTHPGNNEPKPERKTSSPFTDSEPYDNPWNAWPQYTIPSRPVAARANFRDASTDSVPEFAKNTLSRYGTKRNKRSARTPASADTSIWTRFGRLESRTFFKVSRMT